MASGVADSGGKGNRLDSWKAIARYVGRDVRSAQRWERERGLPVHRVPGEKGGSVFAYTAELDDWLHGRNENRPPESSPTPSEPNPPVLPSGAPLSAGRDDSLAADAISPQPLTDARPAVAGPVTPVQAVEPPLFHPSAARRWAWSALAVLVGLTFIGAAYWRLRPSQTHANSPHRRIMLAVLPFANLSGNPSQDYFADGLTEEMITDLGRLNPQALGVIARTSAMRYKGTPEDIGQIGRDLGVGYVVEGSVRREGDRVRISAQLIQVSDQTHIWAQNYERQVKEILGVQRDVAEAIAGKIRVSLEHQPGAGLGPVQAANPEAYDDYLKGLYFWNRRETRGVAESIKYFNQAIQEDPNYAPAYAALAESYTLDALASPEPKKKEEVTKAENAARKAIALDDSAAEGHTALAGIRVFFYYDFSGAEAEFKRALELNPNYAPAHHWYGNLYLDPQGRYLDAIAELKMAQQLDPTNLIVNADLGLAYYFARQYQLAVETCKKTIDMDPSFLPPQWYLADAYHQLGMIPEEVNEYAQFTSLTYTQEPKQDQDQDRDWGKVMLSAYQAGGYKAYLQAMLSEFQAAHRADRSPPERLATTYMLLGQNDKALDALERSYQQHAPNIIYLKADPYYDPLRTDPRFVALERKLGLPTP
jgi:TolB-like protein/Tfp pilus assembly protein PilF